MSRGFLSNPVEVPQLLTLPSSTEARLVRHTARDQLGIAVKGAKFVCPLPKGYSERVQVCDFFGFIIAVEQGMAPLLIDGDTGTAREVDFNRIQAEALAAQRLAVN